MSLLPPLGLPVASPSGMVFLATKHASGLLTVSGTASPSGRIAGSDIVTQPDRVAPPDNVTPSRTTLEVRRAVEADMLARSEDAAAKPDLRTPDAPALYVAARQMLPV